eukprot:2764326-Prymnesium_polylepis.1
MLPRCNVCSPPQPHLPFTTFVFSLAVLAWVVVFVLSARDLWTLCPAGGAESVCVPYRMLNFREIFGLCDLTPDPACRELELCSGFCARAMGRPPL